MPYFSQNNLVFHNRGVQLLSDGNNSKQVLLSPHLQEYGHLQGSTLENGSYHHICMHCECSYSVRTFYLCMTRNQ